MTERELSLPRLNEPAPDFEANTTLGKIKLGDYKGKWVVLFSTSASEVSGSVMAITSAKVSTKASV